MEKEILIDLAGMKLAGKISCVTNPKSWIIFAHGRAIIIKSDLNI